jgi:hypothetical protein
MARELSYTQKVERSIIKTYRKEIWNPFVEACQNYHLINGGDRIVVQLDGTAQTLLVALCLNQLKRVSDTDFEPYICAPENTDIPLDLPVKRALSEQTDADKYAVSDNMTDAVCSVLDSILFKGTVTALLPKENCKGKTLVRPLFCVSESSVKKWAHFNSLDMPLATNPCNSAENEAKQLLETLKKDNPEIEHNIFKSIHNVKLDTFTGYNADGANHSFLEKF